MTIMAEREGLEFESELSTDSAPLHDIVSDLLQHCGHIHCLRDLTRGGLASGVVEIAKSSGFEISIEEKKVPVNES
jgi:hydrogenase expression/formation protein HypE